MSEQFHYTDSGLDNVWLVNGFTLKDTAYGPAVAIEDVDGLHRELARTLAEEKTPLTGRAIRFLRKELGLSQADLGRWLGCSDQTVARWEKGQTPVDQGAERLIRLSVLEWLAGDVHVREALQELADRDENAHGRHVVRHEGGRWRNETLIAA